MSRLIKPNWTNLLDLQECRVTILSLRKRRTDSLKVITFADVQLTDQNQVKSEKRNVITSTDVQFSAQNQVKSRKRSSRPQFSA